MRYVTDVVPNRCPACGEAYTWAQLHINDFIAGASQACQCGAEFQYVPADAIKAVAEQHGDADRYWR